MRFTSGHHYVLDIKIPIEEIMKLERNIDKYFEIMNIACEKAKVNIIQKTFHKFEPIGFTALYLLSESHMSIHTYPENGYIAMDLYTCSPIQNLKEAIDYIESVFKNEYKAEVNGTLLSRSID